MYKNHFYLDKRSLALFRIIISILLLSNLLLDLEDVKAFYTDDGILPRALLSTYYPAYNSIFCFNSLSGSYYFQVVLIAINIVCGIYLLVGYKTRQSTFLCWILLLSLHDRNPMILAGDVMLRLLLFWSIFLPLGDRYSIDSCFGKSRVSQNFEPSFLATIAFTFQLCAMYWFSAYSKSSVEWHSEGTAVYYALCQDKFVTAWGKYLLNYPTALTFLTHFILCMEWLGPLLLFVPVYTGRMRVIAIGMFTAMHIGFGFFLNIGQFSYFCIAAWMALLPREFWQFLSDSKIHNRFLNLHKNIFSRYNVFLPFSRIDISRYSRKLIYRLKSSYDGVDDSYVYWNRNKLYKLREISIGILIVYVLSWNLSGLDDIKLGVLMPSCIKWVGPLLGIDQRWRMFSEFGDKVDGWYVIPAVLRNGQPVDLFRDGKPISWRKPELASSLYKNQKWLKYLTELPLPDYTWARPDYARYIRDDWNYRHDSSHQIVSFSIYYMREQDLLNNQTRPLSPLLLFKYNV